MNDSDNRAYATHDSATMLLPWYINGSLDKEQRKIVESHIAVCLTCRAEFNAQRRIAQLVQSRDTASVGADTGFAQLRRRIRPERRTLFSRARDWSCSKLRAPAWAWASGIAVAASVFMALPLLHGLNGPVNMSGSFRTLSADNGHLGFHANNLRLVFSEGLEDETRQAILRKVNPVAVTTPSPRGVLTVQVADGELASALALLRDQKEVLLAEPVFSAAETAGSD